MNEKEIYMLGVRTVLDELNKRMSQNGSYVEGLLAGIEIGVKINDRYETILEQKFPFSLIKTETEDSHLGNIKEESISEIQEETIIQESKHKRRRRKYDSDTKKQIVAEVYQNDFDVESVRTKYDVLGNGTIPRWIEQYSGELGLDIEQYKFFQRNKKK